MNPETGELIAESWDQLGVKNDKEASSGEDECTSDEVIC